MAFAGAKAAVKKMHERESVARNLSGGNSGNRVDVARSLEERSFGAVDWKQDALGLKQALLKLEQDADEEESMAVEQTFERGFQMCMSVVVFFNIFLMGLELQIKSLANDQAQAIDVWFYTEMVFLVIYLFEIFFLMFWQRGEWFKSAWNWLDVCCAVSSIFSASVVIYMPDAASSLGLLNLLRFLKLARLVRLVKVAKSSHELYVVLVACYRAMVGISYVICMILMGLFLFAIVATQLLGFDEQYKQIQLGDRTVEEAYGSVVRSMFTLFQLMTLQDFDQNTRPIVMEKPIFFTYFFLFVMLFSFGLTNMLVGLVVEKTLMESESLKKDLHRKKDFLRYTHLQDFFERCDTEGTGEITRRRFEELLQTDEALQECWKEIGCPQTDMRDLFNIVDLDGNGSITDLEFISGCLRLNASHGASGVQALATHAGVRALTHQVDEVSKRQTEFHERFERLAHGQSDLIAKQADLIMQLNSRLGCSPHSSSEAAEFSALDKRIGVLEAACETPSAQVTEAADIPEAIVDRISEAVVDQIIRNTVHRIGLTISASEQELQSYTDGFIAATRAARDRIEECAKNLLAVEAVRRVDVTNAQTPYTQSFDSGQFDEDLVVSTAAPLAARRTSTPDLTVLRSSLIPWSMPAEPRSFI